MSALSRVRARRQRSPQAGFSLVEVMIVTAIMGVVTGIAVVTIGTSRKGLTGDGAMRTVLAQLNTAKEQAITQRRNMRVTFTTPNSVQILREEVPAGAGPTALSSVPFEGRVQYLRPIATNTPDGAALPATSATAFQRADGTSATEMKFTPEGTFIDENGSTLNGTVFVALPNDTLSARAITILGSTGRIRAYRWNGNAWKVV